MLKRTENIYFICVDNNAQIYDKCVGDNKFIRNKSIACIRFDNTIENQFIPVRYNYFLSNYNYSKEAWFIFAHNDWELREDIEAILLKLDKESIYGPIGAYLYKDSKGTFKRKWYGECYEKNKDDSDELLYCCNSKQTGIIVDTLDCQCMLVHSSLVKEYNLRFDENLEFDLYVEDFCLNAYTKYNIRTRIANLKCCHWSKIINFGKTHSYFKKFEYVNRKYNENIYAGIMSLIGRDAENTKFEDISSQRTNIRELRAITNNSTTTFDDVNNHIFKMIENKSFVLEVAHAEDGIGYSIRKYRKKTEDKQLTYNIQEFFELDLNNLKADAIINHTELFDHIILNELLQSVSKPDIIIEKLQSFLKPDGYFIISFHNISHASIKMNLLRDDWNYDNTSILNTLNLRFFTYKSIIKFTSDLRLYITEMRYIALNRNGGQCKKPWRKLPFFINWFICTNPHSFVFKYILKMKNADLEMHHAAIEENNENLMQISYSNMNNSLKKYMGRGFYPVIHLFLLKLHSRLVHK